MHHHYLNFSESVTYPGKFVVGTTSYTSNGNGLIDKRVKVINIPSSIYGIEVAEIGCRSFRQSGITSVFIPKTVLHICPEAFDSCKSLTEVRFEEGSKLEKLNLYIFYHCTSLKKIDIPSSVTNILTSSSYLFFRYVSLECFSYTGTQDFSSLNYFFDTVTNVYVSNSYPSDKFSGKTVSKGTMTCGVSKEPFEVSRRFFKCSVAIKRICVPFQQYMFLLIHS
jgi:hypothetical protein